MTLHSFPEVEDRKCENCNYWERTKWNIKGKGTCLLRNNTDCTDDETYPGESCRFWEAKED